MVYAYVLGGLIVLFAVFYYDKHLRQMFFCDFLGLHWWGPWNVDDNRWCVNCHTRQKRI